MNGANGADQIFGGDGDGGDGSDTIRVGAGNDVVTGANGRDTIDTAAGDDLVDARGVRGRAASARARLRRADDR